MIKPKICVPITGKTIQEIEKESREAKKSAADIIEWRADYFSGISSGFNEDTQKALKVINEAGKPVIFTLRLNGEGGAVKIPQNTRHSIMLEAINLSAVNYIDIEFANGADFISPLAQAAHRNNIKVIISGHDFTQTPQRDEIVSLLCEYGKNFADLVKIAVMPQRDSDVFMLLSAALKYSEMNGSLPLIAISMGELGLSSRIYGGLFGSVLTFAQLNEATAPGQIPVERLEGILAELHKLPNGEAHRLI
ncbi:MAG: type I 3-dehydroquinate dehydratase [Clostridiales bacterium]|jgi:3-dehydroquinate dehydratase-1|nr:type I 3-dehydroquinate dehydratase [Clostridiales bacterium]